MTHQPLFPCPFCGYDADVNTFNEGKHSVECLGCGSRGQYYQTEDAAIKFWNERTSSQDEEKQHRESFEEGFAVGVYESKKAVSDQQTCLSGIASFVYCSKIHEVLCDLLTRRIEVNGTQKERA